ncbi:MAG: hypothetical protein J4F40_07370 [Alphaproteobacteria bacterium]|nr:hypothetical protein [Alphaproteobacteria bacterium]
MDRLPRSILLGVATSLVAQAAYSQIDINLFAGLKARSIGPATDSGRVTAIDVVETDTNTIYIGAADGGVWKSVNAGLNWEPIFDQQAIASIGAIAVNQQDPNIVWVGTGESNVRNSVSVGGGVFKSIDAGATWQMVGLEDSQHTTRIALHPTNPGVAYVAALGKLWGPSTERGIFKTIDGGETWERVLYIDENTGGGDIVVDRTNPDKLYAAMWQVRRQPWFFESGGPSSGMYISHDGGESWERKTVEDGLPAGDLGRITFTAFRGDSNILYAFVEATESAILRSDDGGQSWTIVNQDYDVARRPFYFGEILVDPVDPDRIYNLNSLIHLSVDGGRTFAPWQGINAIHVDHHAMWINPHDSRHAISGNDGGIGISQDQGNTWRYVRNLPLSQYYHVAVDDDVPYNIYGGLQDNSSQRGPSEVWENGGIRNFHWQNIGISDGFDTIPDPRDSMTGYTLGEQGYLYRWDMHTGEKMHLQPVHPDPDVRLRFNWNTGFELDPFDPDTLYIGSQFVHKSTDRGNSFTLISGDMTTNNPEWQRQDFSGGVILDATGAENFTTILSIAASPVREGVIWVGTDDGNVHVTEDGGETWTSVGGNVRGVPDYSSIPHIEPSPHDASVAHIVYDNHRRADLTTYVYRVEDYGGRWRSLGDETLRGHAYSIRQDPVDPDLLFLGTGFGLFVTLDGGESWFKWTMGIPTSSVRDIAIQARESDLVVATHGRGIFVIDDFSALRNLSEDDFSGPMKLLSATDGQQYRVMQSPSTGAAGSGEFRAPNEPYGAMITFLLSGSELPGADTETRTSSEDGSAEGNFAATISISNAEGETIRTFSADVHQGINRIVWDMRHDNFRMYPSETQPKALPGPAPYPSVYALPGPYDFTMSYEDQEIQGSLNVLADPRFEISDEDRQAHVDAILEVAKLKERNVIAIERILDARRELENTLTLAMQRDEAAGISDGGAHDALSGLANEMNQALDDAEFLLWSRPGTVWQTSPTHHLTFYKINKVLTQLTSHWGRPTQGNLRNIRFAEIAMEEAEREVERVMASEVTIFRNTAAELGTQATQ